MRHIISGVVVTAIACMSYSASAAAPSSIKKSTVTSHQNDSADAIRSYVGLEYGQLFKSTSNGYAKRYHSVTPNLGFRTDHFGLEAGYLRSPSESVKRASVVNHVKSISKAKTYIDGFHVDGNAYLPLTNHLEAIGSVGIGSYKWNAKYTFSTTSSNTFLTTSSRVSTHRKAALRLGIGLQANLSKNVSLRAMARHVDHGFKWKMNDGWMGTVGVNYTF